jgi:phosphate-selective porin OprO/OprP
MVTATRIWVTTILLCCFALGVQAQDGAPTPPDPMDEIGTPEGDLALADLLRRKGLITQDEFEDIRDRVRLRRQQDEERALQRTLERLTHQPPPDGWLDGDDPEVRVDHGGLTVVSSDGSAKFSLGGRMQMDANAFDEDISPMGNGTESRRFRVRTSGNVDDSWAWKFEVDFANTRDSDVTDAWIKYGPWEQSDILVGHQKVPISQQSMTSSNWQLFQERALPDAFIDNRNMGRRRLGATATTWGDHVYASAGLFGEGLNNDGPNNEDWGVAGRVVAAPWAEDDSTLAVGGAVYARDLSSNSLLRFRSRPEAHVAATRLVDTGVIGGAEDLVMANAEVTWIEGPFHAEAEVFEVQVDRNGMDNVTFDGLYAQVGYMLTGETRPYSMKGAKFGRVKPDGEGGAWELAARFSQIDLSNADVRGGRQEDVTVGVNWWINASTAMRLNYVYAHAMETAERLGLASASEHVKAVTARFQVVF